jgi:ATP-dependent DNA helicase PIF1
LNEEVLSLIEEPSSFRYSIDYPIVERERNPLVIPEEFLHTLNPPGMPPHKLHLKVGAIYMLLRNMNVKEGLCNGTRFFLTGYTANVLFCRMIMHDPSLPEKHFMLPRITNVPPKNYPFPFKRRQFPVRPAFALTVNKGQGCTFDAIGLDASVSVFSHGQLYVALSRVKDFHNITVLLPDGEITTRNVVLQEVFDKEYIETQIRIRSQRPIISERFDSNYCCMPSDHLNPHHDEDSEARLDLLDQLDQYDHVDGLDQDDSHERYTYDELAFEEDWIPDDHWQE